ncbi:DUF5777 family beta-barrel protein [uncultured Croceitalea sp.]|uniref:DUF5777 family beta-barrel protein n=1 Tax=uncultured Croceitalea sp. TaxID=1798908 RepID=UPI00330573DE
MKNRKQLIFVLSMFLFIVFNANSQDLLNILEKEAPNTPLYTQATFKANRILIGQSVETRKKGVLEFVLGTRYWNIPNNDTSQSFGADRFSGHFGMQYAFTDRFTFGAGITSFDGIVNGFAKYRLVRQTEDNKVPLGITLVQGASYFSRDFAIFSLPQNSSERLAYATQVILARKFNRNLSLQLTPTYIHSGVNQPVPDKKDFFALGFGGRYKLSNHVTIASEYGYLFGRDEGEEGFNLFSLGVNWEISDLIMQFSMTNSKSFDDIASYTLNANNFHFRPGGLHIGVNATYVLHLKKRKPRPSE